MIVHIVALSPPSFHISISSRKWWWSRPLHNLKSSNSQKSDKPFLHALNFGLKQMDLSFFPGTGRGSLLHSGTWIPSHYPVDNEKTIFPITMFSGCVAKNNHEIRKQLANFLQFKQLKGAVTCQIQRAQKVLLKASNMHRVAVLSIVQTTDQRNSVIQMLIFFISDNRRDLGKKR